MRNKEEHIINTGHAARKGNMKTQIKYTLCYQVVTPESAEHGDFSEHGFMNEHGSKFPIILGREQGPEFHEENTLTADGLGDLIAVAERHGIEFHGDAHWAYSVDPDINYATGEETTYSLHVAHERHHYHVMKALDRNPKTKRTAPTVQAMKGETPADYPQDYNSGAQDLMDPF